MTITKSAIVLVDYDNTRGRREKSLLDLANHSEWVVATVCDIISEVKPDVSEVSIRLYSGWTDAYGHYSRDGLWMLSVLPSLRGRRGRIRVAVGMVTAHAGFHNILLRGLVRKQNERYGQKMVDGLLGCDAILFSSIQAEPIFVVSRDDDLLPATCFAHLHGQAPVYWMRGSPLGQGMNDALLNQLGVSVIEKGVRAE